MRYCNPLAIAKKIKYFQKDIYKPWANIHVDETAIVIGNGNSLNDVPREMLEKYPTFGSNHIYIFNFQPKYYVCVDEVVLIFYPEAIYPTVARADIAFLNGNLFNFSNWATRDLYDLPNIYKYDEYTLIFPGEIWSAGGTVTYVALKMAFGMGFNTILLVGCDRDKEWSHFSDDYPADGGRNEYFLRGQEYHLRIAGEAYKEAGRRIVNLSLPSVLDEYFERGRMEDWTDGILRGEKLPAMR